MPGSERVGRAGQNLGTQGHYRVGDFSGPGVAVCVGQELDEE